MSEAEKFIFLTKFVKKKKITFKKLQKYIKNITNNNYEIQINIYNNGSVNIKIYLYLHKEHIRTFKGSTIEEAYSNCYYKLQKYGLVYKLSGKG